MINVIFNINQLLTQRYPGEVPFTIANLLNYRPSEFTVLNVNLQYLIVKLSGRVTQVERVALLSYLAMFSPAFVTSWPPTLRYLPAEFSNDLNRSVYDH